MGRNKWDVSSWNVLPRAITASTIQEDRLVCVSDPQMVACVLSKHAVPFILSLDGPRRVVSGDIFCWGKCASQQQKKQVCNPHGEQLRAERAIRNSKNRARSYRADSPLACDDQLQQLRAVLLGFHSTNRSRSCEGSWRN